jgi:hypothetical protein
VTPRPPTSTEQTPAGHTVDFWDSVGQDGKPQQRRYLVDGVKLPSVTTITGCLDKPGLIWWAVGLERQGIDHTTHKDEAAERGKQAHAVIVKMMAETGTIGELPEEYRPWGQAAAKWMLQDEPQVLHAEAPVVGCNVDRPIYSGRFDLLAQVQDRRLLVDFKTVGKWPWKKSRGGGKIRPPYEASVLQLNGYADALEPSGYPTVDGLLIVRLGPDGKFRANPVPFDVRAWRSVLSTYQSLKRVKSATLEMDEAATYG